jgi:hypothetical protein
LYNVEPKFSIVSNLVLATTFCENINLPSVSSFMYLQNDQALRVSNRTILITIQHIKIKPCYVNIRDTLPFPQVATCQWQVIDESSSINTKGLKSRGTSNGITMSWSLSFMIKLWWIRTKCRQWLSWSYLYQANYAQSVM